MNDSKMILDKLCDQFHKNFEVNCIFDSVVSLALFHLMIRIHTVNGLDIR